jgi:hypothetical protein
VDVFSPQQQMNLTSASKLAEAGEYLVDGFLDANVRVKTQTNLTMPDVANRHGDAQLASSRLGARGIKHPRAQDAQLELANAALHAQKQPIVGTTRIIDAIEIDDARLNEAAEFKQVMPIAAVSGEAGGVKTQNSPDISGTEPRDQLLKTRAGHGPACGTTQIVIDHLDIPKSPPPRFIDKLILSTLALEVELNLSLSGLANVNDGLALEERRRQQISVRHRRPP